MVLSNFDVNNSKDTVQFIIKNSIDYLLSKNAKFTTLDKIEDEAMFIENPNAVNFDGNYGMMSKEEYSDELLGKNIPDHTLWMIQRAIKYKMQKMRRLDL